MFTGIITHLGQIVSYEQAKENLFHISADFDFDSLDIGASVAHDGVCMTVVDKRQSDKGLIFSIQASGETMGLTTMQNWQVGQQINLERALKAGDELGGHIVSGHVDGMGTCLLYTSPSPRDLSTSRMPSSA